MPYNTAQSSYQAQTFMDEGDEWTCVNWIAPQPWNIPIMQQHALLEKYFLASEVKSMSLLTQRLMLAVIENESDLLAALLLNADNGDNISAKYFDLPDYESLKKQIKQVFIPILQAPKFFTLSGKSQKSVIQLAIELGHLETFRVLCLAGANLDHSAPDGTSLLSMMTTGHLDAQSLDFLNAALTSQSTPRLAKLGRFNWLGIDRLGYQLDYDLFGTDQQGNTMLHHLAIIDAPEAALAVNKILGYAGYSTSKGLMLFNKEGEAPIHLMAKYNNLTLLNYLSKHHQLQSLLNYKNACGKIGIEIAIENHHLEAVRKFGLLMEHQGLISASKHSMYIDLVTHIKKDIPTQKLRKSPMPN